MMIGNVEPIKNEIIQVQLLFCELNFLEPDMDKVLHVQAAQEIFEGNKMCFINSGYQCGVHGQQVRDGQSFEGEHWEKR